MLRRLLGAKSAAQLSPRASKLQTWNQLEWGRPMKAKWKPGAAVSPRRLSGGAGGALTRQRLGMRGAGGAGGTRGPVGSFHGLSALQKRKTLAHRKPPGPRSCGRIRASGGSPPPNCPRTTDRPEGPRGARSDTGHSKHSTVLKTHATQASVLPWKFYISLVYFFQIFSKILHRTCSHLTNVRLNRSQDTE